MLQLYVGRLKHFGANIMGLKEPAEVEDRDLIGDAVQAVDAGKAAPHRRVVQRFLHRGIARRVALLREMDLQHVMRLDLPPQ